MKSIFIDTNILLEVILSRSEKVACQQILQAGVNEEIHLYASFLTFANVAYVLQRSKVPREQIYQIERLWEQRITVLGMDGQQLRLALQREVKDFEDMLQYQCAIAGGCDCIVTINTKDFNEFCSLPVLAPSELLDVLNG